MQRLPATVVLQVDFDVPHLLMRVRRDRSPPG